MADNFDEMFDSVKNINESREKLKNQLNYVQLPSLDMKPAKSLEVLDVDVEKKLIKKTKDRSKRNFKIIIIIVAVVLVLAAVAAYYFISQRPEMGVPPIESQIIVLD
jgi:hypothetical protein